ncbi:hypothetical protein [Haloarcula pellucida]|uniref:hypothetical protein n=1 Tax=Haloarcula pellucida TaxID=1427151 RepID=UPI001667C226|nr:hypothetical protein [Halomicroarcula pellucida]
MTTDRPIFCRHVLLEELTVEEVVERVLGVESTPEIAGTANENGTDTSRNSWCGDAAGPVGPTNRAHGSRRREDRNGVLR